MPLDPSAWVMHTNMQRGGCLVHVSSDTVLSLVATSMLRSVVSQYMLCSVVSQYNIFYSIQTLPLSTQQTLYVSYSGFCLFTG